MATSRTPDQFRRRINLQIRGLEEGVERLLRGTFLTVDQVAVTATPVDTGRARANWLPSVGGPIEGDAAPDTTGQSALSAAQSVAGTYRISAGPLVITNNVEYISFLENGSSAQAPNGMLAQAVAAGINYVRQNSTGRILRRD